MHVANRMGFRRVGALAKYITSDVAPHQVRSELVDIEQDATRRAHPLVLIGCEHLSPDLCDGQARTVAYRHWAYPDEDVSKMDSSIMMAVKLRAGQV